MYIFYTSKNYVFIVFFFNPFSVKKIMVKHSIIESKDDKESQKSDSVTVVDRKEERHEAKGSPVFGCLNDQGTFCTFICQASQVSYLIISLPNLFK
jgi:hypothetical protein